MRHFALPWRQLSLGLLFLLVMAGCAVEHGGVKTSRIWRERWWNYYERGLLYAARASWPEAVADFQAAIAQEPRDDRDARTYGMHFLDYFPHRELGVVYYQLNRYAEAAQELEASLATVQTARAKFYLNRARQRQLEHTGRDTTPPRIALEQLPDGLRTNRLALTVRGHAEDDTYVAALAIQGQEQFVELAEPRLRFTQAVPLRDGPNRIEVVATDLVGRQQQVQRTVYVDRHAPLLSLARVTVSGAPRRARIEGVVTDDSPIQRFTLADRQVAVSAQSSWEFREDIPLAADMPTLRFEVEDAAGNITQGEIALSATPGSPAGVREGKAIVPPLPRWAALSEAPVLSDLPRTSLRSAPLLVQNEVAPPRIHLTMLDPVQVVYSDVAYLGGKVTAANTIAGFTINGASHFPVKATGRLQPQQLFFGSHVPLDIGENRFRLEARDDTGQTAVQEIVLHRQVQEFRQLAARWHIVILPFEYQGTPSPLGVGVYDHLLTALVQQDRFRLVERERLDDILREIKLLQGTRVDPSTAIRIGKLAAAESNVSGVVIQRGPDTLEVIAHFTDIETSKVLATLDVYGENLTRDTIKPLLQGLAWKFQQRFPLLEGTVMERNGQHVLINHHHPHVPLQAFMKLLLFREPNTVNGRARLLGEARVETVSDSISTAVLLPSATRSGIQKLDKYITK